MSGGRVSAPVFRNFYENYIKLHPELKRKFDIPKGVKKYKIGGKEEIFTTKSPPVKENVYVPVI